MKSSSKNSSPDFYLTLSLSLILSITCWNCALIRTQSDFHNQLDSPAFRERCLRLEDLASLTCAGQISIESDQGGGVLFFELEYRTLDTMLVRIQDPLGRKLAQVELNGETYQLWLQREGRYFSGTRFETDLLPLPLRRLDPKAIRRGLLGLPLMVLYDSVRAENQENESGLENRLPGIQYKFLSGQPVLARIDWRQADQQIQIRYREYVEIAHTMIPTMICINDASDAFSLEIHFSHFNREMIKFKTL